MVSDLLDKISNDLSEFHDRNNKIFGIALTFLRWLFFTIPPFFIGGYADFVFQQHLHGINIFKLDFLLPLWPFIPCSILFILGTIWRVAKSRSDIYTSSVYNTIKWLYHDLGFESMNEADVRCTVWTPMNSKVDPHAMKLVQLIDYYPPYENGSFEPLEFRKNKTKGRIRQVARIDHRNAKILPIGILGSCAFLSIRNHEPKIMFDRIRDGEDFEAHMIKTNFTKYGAKRLNHERKSYMCVPLMDTTKTDIIGLIYMDSKSDSTFLNENGIKSSIEPYLRMVAEVIIKKEV